MLGLKDESSELEINITLEQQQDTETLGRI